MILPCPPGSYSFLHESRERGGGIDRRVESPPVKPSIDENLPLGNVSCKVGNRMCHVVARHCEDGHLRDRTLGAVQSASSFIDGSKVSVHVSGVSSSSRNLFTGC